MTVPLVEFEIEDKNGVHYVLGPDTRHVLDIAGLGMPPIEHWTTRSPYQHGETHWGYAFQPRIVSLMLITRACERADMYDKRGLNAQMMSPLISPLVLWLKRNDGQKYALREGWYIGGYELDSADQSFDPMRTGWNQIGGAQIKFMDPFWKWTTSPLGGGETRDADGRTCVSLTAFTLTPQLVFPFTGPWLMGTTTAAATLACTNDGTWQVLPVIRITGPVNDWTLTNPATGSILTWNGYSIAPAETVTLDMKAKTVLNNATPPVSLATYVGGNFGTFALNPGANALAFWASSGVIAAQTVVACCWFVEALGV
jgi:hypothetical protein